MAAFILRSDYRIMKLRLNQQKKTATWVEQALAGVQSIRNTDKSSNKLALIVTCSMNKAPYSSLTPIYLPPTQQGENKTATVWTICTPFSPLMSCFPVWQSPWSRADARCPRIMGLSLCTCYRFATLNNEAIWAAATQAVIRRWCSTIRVAAEDDYGF